MKKHFLFILLLFILSQSTFAGIGQLLPKPQQIFPNGEHFHINRVQLKTPIETDQWRSFFDKTNLTIDPFAKNTIEVNLVKSIEGVDLNPEEAYILNVTKNSIKITAISPQGVYWAIQTLTQLICEEDGEQYIEGCRIIDFPAFRIRGFMQDVGRTYISMDELKKEISRLSQYKINVFHWHLTENQGWRLESKIFPELNAYKNYERMAGKYYTLEEAKELVEFCKKHNVLLIPEIDMPGHSAAFTRAFGYDMQSEQGVVTLKQLMTEICNTFDVPYIHIGTDEVEFTNPNFVPEMVAHVRGLGKKVISWNPGWNYKVGEIDMTHLWSYRGTPQKGIPAIDSRLHYINHFDAFGDIIALYNSKILNVEKGSFDVAGSIIAIWNDRYIESEEDNLKQNSFYPAMLALAERAWLGGGSEYFDKNGTILKSENDPEFIAFKNFEDRMLWHKSNNFQDFPFSYVKQTNIKWRITDPFPNDGDLSKTFPPEKNITDKYEYEGKTYNTKEVIGAGIYLRHVWGNTVKSFYTDPKSNNTAYAYTYVYSEKSQNVGLWVDFQNYSRSEKDLPPPQGKWDYKKSKIWINDEEIMPPLWMSEHTVLSNEIPLTNENFQVRKPLEVHLNKGWNKVLLKLPVANFSSKEVRLVKWMFTCVFVDLQGKNEIEGLIYSPDKIK